MTGFWQVNGRNHVTLEDRVELEAWYVRNWNIWFDCIILGKTFKAVFFPHKGHHVINGETAEATAQRVVMRSRGGTA